MDPRSFSDVAHFVLHLGTYLLPNCPSCSCSCPSPTVTEHVPASIGQALDFCHNIAKSCHHTESSAPESSWSLILLFWLGFFCGILVCAGAWCLLQFVKRVLVGDSAAPATTGGARLAVEAPLVAEPANPKRLRELGIIR